MNIAKAIIQTAALGAAIGFLMFAAAPRCEAGSWIFRRSYYSHQGETRIHVGGRASTRVYYTRPHGGYIRGGYRHLRVGGNLHSYDDHYHFYESWYQVGGQY